MGMGFVLELDFAHEICERKRGGADFRRGIGNDRHCIFLSQH